MRSRLIESKPISRAAVISARTLSNDCSRCTARCTSGSKSCTPRLRRLMPIAFRWRSRPASTVRGSTSIDISASGSKLNERAQRRHQARQLVVAEEGRRAAAEMQLRHRVAATDLRNDELDFAFQRVADTRPRDRAGASRSCCTRSSSTPIRRTECARTATSAPRWQRDAAQRGEQIRPPNDGDEAVGRRVRGVARAGDVEAAQQFFRDHRTHCHAPSRRNDCLRKAGQWRTAPAAAAGRQWHCRFGGFIGTHCARRQRMAT